MVKGLAVDLIDPDFTKSQIVKGSSKVQQLYGEQNQIKPISKLIARTKSRPLRVLEQGLLNAPINFIRHPIVSLQKSFLHDPIENRDMLFSIAVNEIVQKSIFPDNPELALTLPDDFIKDILEQGKKVRNRNIGVQLFHATSDLLSSLSPFLEYKSKLNFILALTSNSGSADFEKQKLATGKYLYQYVIEKVNEWNQNKNCGIVFGATNIDELNANIDSFGNLPILLPGVGAQGGSLEEVVKTFSHKKNPNFLINISRALIYPDSPEKFEIKVLQTIKEYNSAVHSIVNTIGQN